MDSNSVGEFYAIYTVFSVAFVFSLIALLISLSGTFVLLFRGLREPKLDYLGPWATPRAWLFKRTRRWALWAVLLLAVNVACLSGMRFYQSRAELDAVELRRAIDESRMVTPGTLLEQLWEKLTQ